MPEKGPPNAEKFIVFAFALCGWFHLVGWTDGNNKAEFRNGNKRKCPNREREIRYTHTRVFAHCAHTNTGSLFVCTARAGSEAGDARTDKLHTVHKLTRTPSNSGSLSTRNAFSDSRTHTRAHQFTVRTVALCALHQNSKCPPTEPNRTESRTKRDKKNCTFCCGEKARIHFTPEFGERNMLHAMAAHWKRLEKSTISGCKLFGKSVAIDVIHGSTVGRSDVESVSRTY